MNNKTQNIILVALLIAVAALFALHFFDKPATKVNPNAKEVVAPEGGLRIAYINTDTLMAKYQYAIDLTAEIEAFRDHKMKNAQQQMEQFQKDFENYKNKGAEMTLSQQQAKEEELNKRYAKLQGLEGEVAMQIQEKAATENEKMLNAIYAFIREYNAANQQFDLILAKNFGASPVLYGDEGMDITDEILQGLNEEYASVKKK